MTHMPSNQAIVNDQKSQLAHAQQQIAVDSQTTDDILCQEATSCPHDGNNIN